ncbi:hypothetical protein HDU67_003939, partial [Dinochytrium kinnereticum]
MEDPKDEPSSAVDQAPSEPAPTVYVTEETVVQDATPVRATPDPESKPIADSTSEPEEAATVESPPKQSPSDSAPKIEKSEPTDEASVEDKDAEIARLRSRVAELEREVESLKGKIASSSALDSVSAASGPKLSHATKARINPRKPARKDTCESTSRIDSQIDIDPDSPSPSTPTATEPAEDTPKEVDPTSTEFKKKINLMGGVSALGGFNPFAGGGAPILKPRASNTSRTGSSSSQDFSDLAAAAEAEDEIREWMVEKTGETSVGKENGVPLWEGLKDGHVLCKLVTAIHPENKVTKAKSGKFVLIYQENVMNYIQAAEQLGVSKNMRFSYEDLTDGKNISR